MVGIKNQGKYQKIYDTGKHFVHPLRPAARYAILNTEEEKPETYGLPFIVIVT